jgi:regulator of RNase E activity RraA
VVAKLTQAQLDRLRGIDSPTIANAIEHFKVRDDTMGFTGFNTRCLFPDLGPMVGYAVTVFADASTPGPRRGREGTMRLWEAVAAAPKPVVLVMKDVGPRKTHACHFGDVMCNTARALGAIGLVTDGGVRDLKEVHEMGFHYFSPGAVVSHGTAAFLDVNVPVEIDGCWIQPGALLHGDANGLVVIPDEIADKVADQVDKVRETEGEMIKWINSPDFSVEKLRKRWGL